MSTSSFSDMAFDALVMLGAVGSGDSAVAGPDLDVLRRIYNRMIGQFNTRRRNAQYLRSQEFTFGTSKESYSIGASADSPDFVVASGGRPQTIESAEIVITDATPNSQIVLNVINQDQYYLLAVPTLSSTFPTTLYYERSYPNGTLRPWPTYPTFTSYKLKLQWWDQWLTVTQGNEAATITLPDGIEDAFVMTLAERAYPAFPKRSDFAAIQQQARDARANLQASSVPPPKIDATDGIQTRRAGFNWRSREIT